MKVQKLLTPLLSSREPSKGDATNEQEDASTITGRVLHETDNCATEDALVGSTGHNSKGNSKGRANYEVLANLKTK
jgi:hypothetical protein